jgi:Rod binding domain-containing protein
MENAMQLPQDLALPQHAGVKTARDSSLMTQARALEASFLSEMLAHAGAGEARESFGGGVGEDQFSSFLRDEEAKQMVAHGGIGLAEQLFRAMSEMEQK